MESVFCILKLHPEIEFTYQPSIHTAYPMTGHDIVGQFIVQFKRQCERKVDKYYIGQMEATTNNMLKLLIESF